MDGRPSGLISGLLIPHGEEHTVTLMGRKTLRLRVMNFLDRDPQRGKVMNRRGFMDPRI